MTTSAYAETLGSTKGSANYQTAVALSSFTAAKIADANPIKVSLMSMLLAWPLYIFPFIFVWF